MGLDFIRMKENPKTKNTMLVEPEFTVGPSKDLMIKGRDFYAVWDETKQMWSMNRNDLVRLVDEETRAYAENKKEVQTEHPMIYIPQYLRDSSSGMMDKFIKYCTKHMQDSFVPLNNKVMFADSVSKRSDYCTFKLDYNLQEGSTDCWDRIMDVLYSTERDKLEWLIGAVVNNEMGKIQKFWALYGAPGSGKSTVMNIISDMFKGYATTFSAKALGSATDRFALEPFKNFPILAIEHDADLSRIESNARLNSLVSHEPISVEEKFKGVYAAVFNTFLLIGTNKPIRITDSKSGLLRRLIDVTQTGNKLPFSEYQELLNGVKFEYGAIAKKCSDFYISNKKLYDNYVPTLMMGETNDTFNFFEEKIADVKTEEKPYWFLRDLYDRYKKYCEEANVPYPLSMKQFKIEAKEYFEDFQERKKIDSKDYYNVYVGFKGEKFFGSNMFYGSRSKAISNDNRDEDESVSELPSWLNLKDADIDGFKSKFDRDCKNFLAQLAEIQGDREGLPKFKWENVTTKLKDLDTTKLHYVKVAMNHIVIDFDIKGDNGEKSLEKNLTAASKFPPTYAELSKSGSGVHLHYIYTGGDPDKLSRIYDDNIEIKVFTGKSSLRRRLTKCNDLDISNINSGLPLKEDNKKMVSKEGLKNEKALRTVIKRNLAKEYWPNTAPSVDFIFKALEDAYNGGMQYDVTDLRPAVMAFAAQSSNQSEKCLKKVTQMKWKCKEYEEAEKAGVKDYDVVDSAMIADEDARFKEDDFVFFDVEVFPNLFVVVWKKRGPENQCVTWINPTPGQVELLTRYQLIGFNNRSYDNHILYARILGYTENELYILSQRLISNDSRNATFGDAYNLSFTDIYDFASAGNKMSLKKWEIKLGIHHLELGLPWDQEVPEQLWEKVAEYCVNDVVSTEAVFEHLKGDYMARVILADLANGTPNDTTNSLTAKLIFGKERNPQREFQYRDLSKPVTSVEPDIMEFFKEYCPNMVEKTFDDRSVLPYFEGYEFKAGKSYYKGVEVGEGGRVYAEPGIYYNVALIDVTSMHPHSTIAECLFGSEYTEIFWELVYARVYIKHKDWDLISRLMDGKLVPYVEKIKNGEIKAKDLSNALKTAINSVYGLTSARFMNKFKDERNIDNIVAKRGALFMVDLTLAVQAKGFTVAHIKTDSIKIPNATPEIIQFVMDFAERYGYHFEHEATYERMCLINDAVYIAKYAKAEDCEKLYGYAPGDNKEKAGQWTATGARFAEPYIYKSLFTHEPIEFKDVCVTKSVKTSMVLDVNEDKEDEHDYRFVGRVGSFTPVIQGVGGGLLYRVSEKKSVDENGNEIVEPKYDSVAGTKGYRWLESEVAENVGGIDVVDKSYFRSLADDAKAEIDKFGDFDLFVDDAVVL